MKTNKEMTEKAQSIQQNSVGGKDTLLAQWQTCVEMANTVSQRRDAMNNLFVTLNLVIVAAVSFLWDAKTIALLMASIIVCVVWVFFIMGISLFCTSNEKRILQYGTVFSYYDRKISKKAL